MRHVALGRPVEVVKRRAREVATAVKARAMVRLQRLARAEDVAHVRERQRVYSTRACTHAPQCETSGYAQEQCGESEEWARRGHGV